MLDCEVEFMVVGAWALAALGHPRATGDLDIWVRPTPENSSKVYSALSGFGAPLQSHGVSKDDFARTDLVYQMGIPPRRIDVLTAISGVSFEEAWPTRVEFEVAGRRVPFRGRDALIRNKRATGRLKDLADVERLEGGKPGR